MKRANHPLFHLLILATALVVGLITTGCPPKSSAPLNDEEAREALDEATFSTQAAALTDDTIEISTNFTIGMAVEQAAGELAEFVRTQLPCNTVTVEGATVTVDYGTLEDGCLYRGHTYAGVHVVTLTRNEPGVVEVAHSWQDFTNGTLTVDGAATVTWDANSKTRHVVHELVWTNDTRTVEGSGDRTQSLIDEQAGLAGGIQIDGSRHWKTERGQWDLDIDAVQVRGEDPVPQSGTYTLSTPDGKELVMTFTRIDEDTIEVHVEGTRVPRTFRVKRTGQVTEAESEG